MKYLKEYNEYKKNWMNQNYSISMPIEYEDEHTGLWYQNNIDYKKEGTDDTWDDISFIFRTEEDFKKAYKLSKALELQGQAEWGQSEWGQDFKKSKGLPGFITAWASHINKGHGIFGARVGVKMTPGISQTFK